MTLVLIEGFDHYGSNQTTAKGWSSTFNSMQPGRFAGQCARLSTVTRTKPLGSSYSTIIAGFAFRYGGNGAGIFFALAAGATLTCRLSLDASGHLVVKNSSGTTIATGTTATVANTWYFIEVKLVINGATGSVEVHLNGVTEIASTAGNFGTTNVDTISIGTVTSGTATDFDDMYALDTTGAAPRNSFLGDVRVATIYPNGDGTHTDWSPTGGGSHYTQVDETTPDDDTSYVSDSTPGHIDTYTFSDVDGGATVYGVQTNLYARKDDAATRQIAPVIRQAGTDYVGSTVTLGASYAFASQIYNQDPTNNDWTAANVNADEFGVKEIA